MSKKKVVFIAGVEGSGTSILVRLLSKTKNTMSITYHKYVNDKTVRLPNEVEEMVKVNRIQIFQHIATVEKFDRLAKKIWKYPYSQNHKLKTETLKRLRALKIPSSLSYVTIKRSYPSGLKGDIFPNIADLFGISKNLKIIQVKRNLKMNAASILRRKFVNNISEAIERVSFADRVLKSQLASVENSAVITVSYEDLISNKFDTLSKIEDFLGFEPGELTQLNSWVSGGSVESKKVFQDNRMELEKRL